MIQRIQTLLLLVAVCLISVMLFLPLATFQVNDVVYLLKADALINTMKDNQPELVVWPLFIMLIIMILVPLVTIFMFKKRMLQIRLTIFSSILCVLFYGLFFYEISAIHKIINPSLISYNYWVLALPLVCIILNLLAIRRIGQDEMLIRSLNSNRIR
ncbi:MAG: DUF4293 domain-containing protein [Bacteroidales bacterium]